MPDKYSCGVNKLPALSWGRKGLFFVGKENSLRPFRTRVKCDLIMIRGFLLELKAGRTLF